MTASKFGAATSNADLMARLREVERRLGALETARRLESASIGSGGLRIQGGQLVIQDEFGDDMFRAGGSPGEVFIRPDILAPLARAILAAGVYTAYEAPQIIVGDTSFNYVSNGGPTISDIQVEAGVMIIWIDARIRTGVFNLGESTGEVSPKISGATSVAAGELDRKEHGLVRGTNAFQTDVNGRNTTTFIATGLNPGTHNVEAQYRAFVSGGGNDVLIANRGMAVLAF